MIRPLTSECKRSITGRHLTKIRAKNIVAFLLPIFLILGIPSWFLLPPRATPTDSDAVLVMAGASDGRHELGATLVTDGFSENFVVSNSSGIRDKVGFAHCRGGARPENAKETWCLKADPVTTTGEALAIGRLAEAKGWTSVTAVTNRPHTRRVRTNLEQCTDLEVQVVSIEEIDTTRARVYVVREVAGYIKFWLNDPC